MSIISQAVVAEATEVQEPTEKAPRLIRNLPLTDAQNELLAFEPDHDGNAKAVYALYGDVIRYTDELGWLYWNGRYWERNRHEVRLKVVDTLRQRKGAAVIVGNEQVAKQCGANAGNISSIMTQLEAYAKVKIDQFDTRDDLLPTPDGVIDLRTGDLLQHDPEDGFTWNTTVSYDSHADYSAWTDFLRETVEGGDEAIEALQRFVGYMLTGNTKEEKALYIHGPTRSGKGTFTETIHALLPDPIAQEKSFSTFTAKRDEDTNNFDMASLRNARMVFASESSRYQSLNEAALKNMTGGNHVWAAYKGKDGFSFKPRFKVVLSSNFTVNADPEDNAIWARLIVVNFPNSHEGREDTNLKARFRTKEMQSAILRWAVEGAVKWYRDGLLIPETFKQAKQEQRDKLDTVSMWVEENVEREPSAFTTSEEVMYSYETWCRAMGVEPKRARFFTEALERRGFKPGRKVAPVFNRMSPTHRAEEKRQRGYFGLKLM